MLRRCLVLLTFLAARSAVAAPLAQCDPAALGDAADTARSNIIAAVDGAGALDAWKAVLGRGGAVAWSVTEYNVDARSTFVLAFDRAALRIYRAGAFGDGIDILDRAMAGCVDPGVEPEAIVPWEDVREIEAGNWVVWFKLRKPVEIRSDRGKRRQVKELKAYFHGAGTGDLTYYYNVTRERIEFWNFDLDVYRVENLRGIAVGPTSFQRRLQFILARAVDPEGRIALPRKGRGAGW